MSHSHSVYDGVVSLGQWCATSICLKKLGLRGSSGPFDWLLGKNVDLNGYVDLLVSEFSGFLKAENLNCVGSDVAAGHDVYVDAESGFEFRHDFALGRPFKEEYPVVREKYERRIARLLAMLSAGKRVLLVHYHGEGRYSFAELSDAITRLRDKFGRETIDLMVLESVKSAAQPSSEELEAGVVRVTGDFYDVTRFDPVLGNERLLLDVLSEIKMRGRWKNLFHLHMDSFKRRLRRRFIGGKRR